MPFTHLAIFKWNDAMSPVTVEEITAALTALAAGEEGVQSYRCGADVSRTPDSYDYAVIGVFGSRADFLAYRDHPEHQRILTELIRPNLADRVVVQIED